MKRLVFWFVGAGLGYLALLVLAGWVMPGCVAQRIERRLAASLEAEVSVGDVDLDLIGGDVVVHDLRIVRDEGAVDIAVERVDAEIASMGRVVFDRDLGAVSVRDVDVTLTGAGAVGLRGRRRVGPLSMRSLRLEDVGMVLTPTALLPRLGRVEIRLERALTGPLVLRNALSWLFALEEVEARVDVGGAAAAVEYTGGELRIGAGLFGSNPVTVPFRMPVPDPDALELDQARILALALAKAIGPHAARRWLGRRLLDRVFD